MHSYISDCSVRVICDLMLFEKVLFSQVCVNTRRGRTPVSGHMCLPNLCSKIPSNGVVLKCLIPCPFWGTPPSDPRSFLGVPQSLVPDPILGGSLFPAGGHPRQDYTLPKLGYPSSSQDWDTSRDMTRHWQYTLRSLCLLPLDFLLFRNRFVKINLFVKNTINIIDHHKTLYFIVVSKTSKTAEPEDASYNLKTSLVLSVKV